MESLTDTLCSRLKLFIAYLVVCLQRDVVHELTIFGVMVTERSGGYPVRCTVL